MERLENKTIQKEFLGRNREIFLFVNKPCSVDAFIPVEDKLNILLQIEIGSDECKHSRAGLRIRRKLSPIFTKKHEHITSEYRIIHTHDDKIYLRTEFHCHGRMAGKELYNELVREFFNKN